jgi:hypothetical protein
MLPHYAYVVCDKEGCPLSFNTGWVNVFEPRGTGPFQAHHWAHVTFFQDLRLAKETAKAHADKGYFVAEIIFQGFRVK